MFIVDSALKRRAAEGNPVRVGMIGAGFMARGIANQIIRSIPGLRLVAIANRNVDLVDEGYDMVSGWRYRRQDNLSKRLASQVYNRVTSWLTGVRLHDINCGFKCYKREVLDEVMVYGERHRYIPVLASYRGFRLGEVKIAHASRAHGTSRYGLERVVGGVFSLLTVILLLN